MTASAPSLLAKIAGHALERPTAIAYEQACAAPITYHALASAVATLAEQLRGQLPAAAVVILCGPNTVAYPVAFLAVLAAGATLLPCSPDTAPAELHTLAKTVDAAAVIGDAMSSAALAHLPVRLPLERIALGGAATLNTFAGGTLLLQSSGSTGTPKIVVRSGASLDRAAAAMAKAVGFTADDRVLVTVPLTHSYGLEHGILAPLWAGSAVTLTRGLDVAAVSAALAAQRVTILPGVPSTFEMLAHLADAPAATSLRLAYSAGAPLPLGVFESFRARFGAAVAQLYGASEIGSVTFNASVAGEVFEPASVGRPMDGVSVRMLSDGRVAIRAGSMFDGYLHGDDAEFEDGHFITGDLGRLDAAGRLFITGRSKLLIDVGGLKVNPEEVEAVLRRHPAIGACVVVPLAQSGTVSRLKAIVSPRTAGEPVRVDELRDWARQQLSAHKVPRQFEVRSELPLSATGKVLRHRVSAS